MLEHELQRAVVEAARLLGWRVAHFRPAQTKHGWRTPVSADGKGFPDLVLARDRLLFVELKIHGRKRTAEQERWAEWLQAAGAEYHQWTDHDWHAGRIDQWLAKAAA